MEEEREHQNLGTIGEDDPLNRFATNLPVGDSVREVFSSQTGSLGGSLTGTFRPRAGSSGPDRNVNTKTMIS